MPGMAHTMHVLEGPTGQGVREGASIFKNYVTWMCVRLAEQKGGFHEETMDHCIDIADCIAGFRTEM